MDRKKLMVASVVWASALALQAATPIPLNLPRPDGQPGDMNRKVKVYVLAGQSNMVGMGDISGAQRPRNVFFSVDAAIIPGTYSLDRPDEMRSFDSVTVDRHGVYDAQATVYAGPADSSAPTGKPVPVVLGPVAQNLPAATGAQTVVVTAQIDVPVTGMYQVHAGSGDSSHNLASVDGKEVYRREVGGKPVVTKIPLEKGKRYPVRIAYFRSGSAAFWLEQVDLVGKGDLVGVTKYDKKFQYLVDDAGNWTVRKDVFFQEARLTDGGKGCALSAESNKNCLPKCNSIGPEVGFGYVMGTFHDEPVLLIKTAQGNRSLKFDFRPPSSGKGDPAGADNSFEGFEYRAMVKGVRDTLAKLDKVVPGYQGQGYEMAGFFWFQGHKDSGSAKAEYEQHLVNLINDLRKEFNAPKMPAVVATVGFHGYRLPSTPWQGVWEAQMAVGDPKQHPEFAGNVASVDTRDFWREVEESPRGQDYHYNRNAETYMWVGEAAGRAMVRLQGGEAEAIPKSDREARAAVEIAKPAPTAEQVAAHTAAMRPMLIDGALASFLNDPRNQADLQSALTGAPPAKASAILDDALDLVAGYYRAAGISDYDWKPVVDTTTARWDYLSFDLPGSDRKTRSKMAAASNPDEGDDAGADAKSAPKGKKAIASAPPAIVLPAGVENWFAPAFDATQAGWKSGVAPFGEICEGGLPEWVTEWQKKRGRERPQPATVTDGDVLLMRQTFDLPPFKDGYRYRIRIAGSAHNNMGEGYAIYINGKPMAEVRDGLTAWHRQVFKTRGAMVPRGFHDELKGGKATIAVANYPLWGEAAAKFIAPGPALSVWIEEQKLPPLAE